MSETLTEAMQRVKQAVDVDSWCREFLIPKGSTFVCPCCNSGGHDTPTSDSAFYIRNKGWRCFSCNKGGDIFDLAGIIYGTDDKAEQLDHVARWAGIEGWQGAKRNDWTNNTNAGSGNVVAPTQPAKQDNSSDENRVDFTEGRAEHRAYIARAQENVGHPDSVAYLASRGIDIDTARRWGLGYDPNAGGAKHSDGTWCRRGRIVIPWPGDDSYYHVDRSIASDVADGKYYKPRASEVGQQPMWDTSALDGEVFFVVEGALDALAIADCGYHAVAVCSTDNTAMTKILQSGQYNGTPILMLDNDQPKDDGKRPGQDGQEKMRAAIESSGRVCVSADVADVLGGKKDPFEAWSSLGREWLSDHLRAVSDSAIKEAEQREEEVYADALSRLRVLNPIYLADDIFTLRHAQDTIPTGISSVDDALGGGLPSRGVVTLGAVSSVGKTTYALQVADSISRSGRGVLFTTIEQSGDELVAKSLSRLLSTRVRRGGGRMMASAQAIMSAAERARWEREDREKVEAFLWALNAYDSIVYRSDGTRAMNIMEADGQPTVADVRTVAEVIARHDGKPPVCFIDYLQLLAPEVGHERDSDKQVVDRNMMALRQMARDLNTCVVVISSLNRASYNGSISLESFKESGSVEYASDVLMGLQPRGMEADLENKAEQKARNEAKKGWREFKASERRDCELVILKNRNAGLPRYGVPLVYEAVCNTFVEPGTRVVGNFS